MATLATFVRTTVKYWQVTIRQISNGTELQISKASQLHDQGRTNFQTPKQTPTTLWTNSGDYTCGLSAPNSTLIVHTVEVAPKTTPAPQLKTSTTPEAEATSTADDDATADVDAVADVDAFAEADADAEATSGADLQDGPDSDADTVADATAEVFQRVNIGGDKQAGFHIFKFYNSI